MYSINMLKYISISYYNGADFFSEMNQSETRIACGGHVC